MHNKQKWKTAERVSQCFRFCSTSYTSAPEKVYGTERNFDFTCHNQKLISWGGFNCRKSRSNARQKSMEKLQGKKLRAQCTDPIKRTFAEHLERERGRRRWVGWIRVATGSTYTANAIWLKEILRPSQEIATPPADSAENCIQAKHAECHEQTEGLRVLWTS